MVPVLLIGCAVVTSSLVACALRPRSLVSALLLAYLALVGNVGMVTWALSPFRAVTLPGLGIVEAVLLLVVGGWWWRRGRPGLPLGAAREAAREILTDPVIVLFLVLVVVLLGYELVIGAVVAPNNGDTLAYHLARAAAWLQHGGIYWVPNTPDFRINIFQPLAEQEILFLFVATGTSTLLALPQLLAEVAILVAVYGASRRLGFPARAAAGGAFLVATFSTVALEATTAQNDLVAAALPVIAACLLLGEGRVDAVAAGIAVGLGFGTKLDTVLLIPVLAVLALTRGRRTVRLAAVGTLIGFVGVGMWTFVLNLVSSGLLLGPNSGPSEDRASPSYPGSVATLLRLLYGSMDLSVLSNHVIYTLAGVGSVGAIGAAVWASRRRSLSEGFADAAGFALPFLAPLLVLGGSGLVAFVAARWGLPIRGPQGITHYINSDLNETWTRISNGNYSALGPLGITALLAAIVVTLVDAVRGPADARRVALTAAFPLFLAFLALGTSWSTWLVRFLVMPAILAAPLLAVLFRSRAVSAAYLVVAALTIWQTVDHDQSKPIQSPYGFGPSWGLTREHALETVSRYDYAGAIAAYDRLVPPHACVGAVLSGGEPSYYLYGSTFQHRVAYLSVENAVLGALREGLFYVVITRGPNGWAAQSFRAAGWRIRPLGSFWVLASYPNAGSGICSG